MNRYIVIIFLVIIGFTIGETVIVVAESGQLDDFARNDSTLIPPNTADNKLVNLDDKRIILTWLKTNGTDVTQSDPTPTFIIDKHDFIEAFSQLFEDSNNNHNTTTNAIE